MARREQKFSIDSFVLNRCGSESYESSQQVDNTYWNLSDFQVRYLLHMVRLPGFLYFCIFDFNAEQKAHRTRKSKRAAGPFTVSYYTVRGMVSVRIGLSNVLQKIGDY